MSLWTPSGEHRVDPQAPQAPSTPSTPSAAGSPAAAPEAPGEPSLEDLSPEQRAQVEEMTRQMEAAQERMLRTPAGTVVGQQAAQFYELAAVYLSQSPPRIADARIAIDALAAVVERLGNRLGEIEQPLRNALNQVQLAFIDINRNHEAATAPAGAAAASAPDEPADAASESDAAG